MTGFVPDIKMSAQDVKKRIKKLVGNWKRQEEYYDYHVSDQTCRQSCLLAIDAAIHEFDISKEGKDSALKLLYTTKRRDQRWLKKLANQELL